ncbi:MAG: TolB-like protein [Paraglaciecola sp.]|jgi:TolB-like protein
MKYGLLSLFFLFGCTETPNNLMADDPQTNASDPIVIVQDKASHTVSYYDKPLVKNVNDYAKWITQDLFSNYDFPSNKEVFIVADLATLDSDLNKTNHFGRQVTEAIIHEVNRTGFSVIDIRSQGFLRVSEQGDIFFQTRDYQELANATTATTIITGTMTRHRGGYLLNVRAVALKTLVLVSTAQIFVPYKVVDSVMLEDSTLNESTLEPSTAPKENGIKLKQFIDKE